MNLPRMVRQYVIILRAQTRSGTISSGEAGHQLADYLTEKYPSLARDVLVHWCTARFRRYNPLPVGWVAQELWPSDLWQQPLSEAVRYYEKNLGMTSRFARRDGRRLAELDELKQAARGDLSMTLEEAYRLAHPEEGEQAV